jgi:hypothetical protein
MSPIDRAKSKESAVPMPPAPRIATCVIGMSGPASSFGDRQDHPFPTLH